MKQSVLYVVLVFILQINLAFSQDLPCPNYQVIAADENWSTMVYETQSDFWTPMKYQRFSTEKAPWLSFGGQMRNRTENWQNFNFNTLYHDTFNLWRLLLHADLHLTQYFRFFVEGKSALSSNRNLPGGVRNVDRDELDLQQAFLDVPIPMHQLTTIVRPGRQELQFGAQRLVSPLPWTNTMRTWDGVRALINTASWNASMFYTHFVPVLQTRFNKTDPHQAFGGLYATRETAWKGIKQDIYGLYFYQPSQLFAASQGHSTVGAETTYTFGTRLFGFFSYFPSTSFDIEGAYQTGRYMQKDVQAFMFAGLTEFPVKPLPGQILGNVGLDYASGGTPNNTKTKTFNQIYNFLHKYYGWMDFVARQNAVDVHGGFKIQKWNPFLLGADYHQFWLANSNDAYFNAAGAILRGSGTGRSNQIGGELDNYIAYKVGCHLSMLLSYCHFFPGLFIKQTGSAQAMDFAFLELTYVV